MTSECDRPEQSPILKPNVLLGEGKDEENFFQRFIIDEEIDGIEVREFQGKDNLEDYLEGLKAASGYHQVRTLAITRDADGNPNGAFNSVQAALRNVGLEVPNEQLRPVGNNPRIVVLILPRANQNGMLEDLCLEAVQDDPAINCVNTFFECVDHLEIQPNNRSKAKVQAFLSTRREDCYRLGIAAHHGCWPFENEAFDIIRELLGIITS